LSILLQKSSFLNDKLKDPKKKLDPELLKKTNLLSINSRLNSYSAFNSSKQQRSITKTKDFKHPITYAAVDNFELW
jgi:hypothetical protein